MMTTDCMECGKTFTRMSLKSRVKYCHDCRRPKKNRYEQRETRTKRQAVDALATQEEHGKRLDAIEMAQEAHLAEVNTISHDVAVKAGIWSCGSPGILGKGCLGIPAHSAGKRLRHG